MAIAMHRRPVRLIMHLVLFMLLYMLKISPTNAQVFSFESGSSGDCRLASEPARVKAALTALDRGFPIQLLAGGS
jgi:hypothetical protein